MTLDDLNRQAGICPFCGAEVQPSWVMCDACGQRLPWAPPKQKKSLNELSDDELATVFVQARHAGTPGWVAFLKTWPGRITLMVIASLLWELFNRLVLHLY